MELKSGAKLDTITDGSIDIYHYNPICVGSYLPTPKKFDKKMAIVNIKHNTKKENENLCFHYSILAYKYYDSLKHLGGDASKANYKPVARYYYYYC